MMRCSSAQVQLGVFEPHCVDVHILTGTPVEEIDVKWTRHDELPWFVLAKPGNSWSINHFEPNPGNSNQIRAIRTKSGQFEPNPGRLRGVTICFQGEMWSSAAAEILAGSKSTLTATLGTALKLIDPTTHSVSLLTLNPEVQLQNQFSAFDATMDFAGDSDFRIGNMFDGPPAAMLNRGAPEPAPLCLCGLGSVAILIAAARGTRRD